MLLDNQMEIISTMLVMPDMHYPFADHTLVKKIVNLHEKKKFNLITFLGDLLENETFSRYERDPRNQHSLEEAIEMVQDLFSAFRKVSKKTRIIVKWGNHDERMVKYAVKNAPELVKANALKYLPELLGLGDYDIESYGYNEKLNLDGLKITHGTLVRELSGYSAHAEIRKAGVCSGISGHTHRLGFVTHRGRSWLECGHLCTTDTSKFIYLADGEADWQQGFAIGRLGQFTNGERKWFMQPIEVVNGCFVVDGVAY